MPSGADPAHQVPEGGALPSILLRRQGAGGRGPRAGSGPKPGHTLLHPMRRHGETQVHREGTGDTCERENIRMLAL